MLVGDSGHQTLHHNHPVLVGESVEPEDNNARNHYDRALEHRFETCRATHLALSANVPSSIRRLTSLPSMLERQDEKGVELGASTLSLKGRAGPYRTPSYRDIELDASAEAIMQ